MDTNIWIYHLPKILEFINDKKFEGYMICVPWKVSHELSKIKDGNDETATRAQNANKEIGTNNCIRNVDMGLKYRTNLC